jgi:hypothetical protein
VLFEAICCQQQLEDFMSLTSLAPNRPHARKRVGFAVALTTLALALGAASPGIGKNDDHDSNAFDITTLSTQPYLVTGGDVLVRVDAPRNVSLQSVTVTVNGTDVTSKFIADPSSQSLTGLVTGLPLGENTLEAGAKKGNGNGQGGPHKSLTITNYPIAGPVISGPHEEPFFCQTQNFTLPTTGGNLGPALDADCSIATRVDYVYRAVGATGNTFKPLNTAAPVPADVAMTTTNAGATVRFIVRVETGTINRGVYQVAILHDPYAEGAPTWANHPRGWNGKLIYQHGGGCQGGWYIQGNGTGGVLTAQHLGQGYARASSTLNVFGNNCNDLLASETTIMVKEHFIEAYGVPKWTIGTGSSGGSYQSNQTGDNYPGIFDGLVTMNTFPDVTTGVITLADSRLLDVLFNTTLPGQFTQDQQKAISGFRQFNEIVFLSRDPGTSALRLDPTQVFNAAVPAAVRYNPTTNPTGARATVYDHTVNVYGEFPNGFARRPLDNVGVQYGLKALNDGAISVDQFLLVNDKIGGADIDFKNVPQRTVADAGAMHRAYVSGRILNTGNGLRNVPIIGQHGVGDPDANGNIHLKFYSYSIRQRLIDQNGTAGNQVIVSPFNNTTDDLFEQMNRWLDAIAADASNQPLWKKVIANKPADVVDACWDASGNKIVDTNASAFGPSPCNTLDPSSMTPNLAAGGPIQGRIIKCQLQAPDPADYHVSFTAAQWTKLNQIFATGVCDWSKPGVEETADSTAWASFGPSPKNLIFDITK